MEEARYKDNEKVLYKVRAKLVLPNKLREEVYCFITDNSFVIESSNTIKIPLICIEKFNITYATISTDSYSANNQKSLESRFDTLTVMFLDEFRKKRKLTIEVPAGDGMHSNSVLTSAIGKVREQWYRTYAVQVNWFQRHLNWTVVLTFMSAYGLLLITALITGFNGISWISIPIYYAAVFVVAGWSLKRKNRSLWWLFIFLVPFGWIVFLCIENRRHLLYV